MHIEKELSLSQLAGELKGAGKSYDGSWDPRHVQIDALLASQECSVHCAFMIAFPVTDDKDRCLLHDKSLASNSGFHLHLLVFSFVYQFKSRIGVLVGSSFANS